jgi:hypothetical protein
MSVYVDDMRAEFGNMIMCHMVADSTEELLAMVDKIGVQRKWIQYSGTYREHFDIALSKKKLAIQNGAIHVTWRWVGMRERALIKKEPIPLIELSNE